MSLDPFGNAPKWQPPDLPDIPGIVVSCRHFPDCKDHFIAPSERVAVQWLAHHAMSKHPHEPTEADRRRIAEDRRRMAVPRSRR